MVLGAVMLQKGYENLSPYFSPRDKGNHGRLLLCTTVLSVTVFKCFLVKGWVDECKEAPSKLLEAGNQDGFDQAFLNSLLAVGVWVFFDFLTAYFKKMVSESLKKRISQDLLDNLKAPKVNLFMQRKYKESSDLMSKMFVDGIHDYSDEVVDKTLGLITNTIELCTAVSAFHRRSNNDVVLQCFLTTVSMSVISFFLVKCSAVIAKDKFANSLKVRAQVQLVFKNAQTLESLKAHSLEVDKISNETKKLNEVLEKAAWVNARNSSFNWAMSEASQRVLVKALAPMIFAKKASLQTDFFALNREMVQIRTNVVWFCNFFNAGNLMVLNEDINKIRADLADCTRLIQNSKLKVKFGNVLNIKKLELYTSDGSKKLLSINDSISFQEGVYLLTGSNGAGKSTFLNALSGIGFEKTEGTIYTLNNNQQIHIPQNVEHIDGISVLDLILYPRKIEDLKPRTPREIRDEITALLDKFELKKLSDDLDQKKNWSTELSGGEKQIISLIQAFIARPKLLLLDEVTSAMSEDNKLKAKSEIKKFSEKNKAVVIHIEHGARNNSEYYTHEIKLAGGRMEMKDFSVHKSR
jgi:ABC-type uncharacterized transport system fused permease/ATPase subunit